MSTRMIMADTVMLEAPGNEMAMLRLLQLVSPALPIGAYAYSQGLESAINDGWVKDEASAAQWILGVMEHSLAALDVPVLARLYAAWQQDDARALADWSAFLQASRETAELQAEDRHLGTALARLLIDLDVEAARDWQHHPRVNLPCLFALAARHWAIPLQDTLRGYVWAWCENQVAAAIKLVPLGQTAGQRILSRCIERIPLAVATGLACADEDIGQLAPGLVMSSARHETQYSRMFRS